MYLKPNSNSKMRLADPLRKANKTQKKKRDRYLTREEQMFTPWKTVLGV